MGIGLDFGTTNSTLAVYDGSTVSYIRIDNAGENRFVMPTANYMSREFTATIGTDALYLYLELNQGRQVFLEEVSLGVIKVTHGESNTLRGRRDRGGDTTVAVEVHAKVDKNMPGHLLRGLKRWLGMGSIETIDIFGVRYGVVALITPILVHIRKRLSRRILNQTASIHLGRPVEFETDSTGGNQMAVDKLRQSCRYAGLPSPEFFPEPLGAALSFLVDTAPEKGAHILAFDFGGGTLDLCLIKTGTAGFTIPATYGIPAGGDRINQLIYRAKIFPELGKDLVVSTAQFETVTKEVFPFRKFEEGLLNWQQTYTLNREEYLDTIDTTLSLNRQDPEIVEKITRLRELITWNYSYSVIQAIEKAKISLSGRDSAWIEVAELDLAVKITRAEFERIISGLLDQTGLAIDRVLERSGLKAASIDSVIATGGSSLIPAVKDLLKKRFPGRVTAYSEFKSIAAGLAIANYHGLTYAWKEA